MWNHDLTKAPTDGTHVILAMPNKTTLRSYWCEPKDEPAHWCMLSHRNVPVAWMLWPKHPFEMDRSTEGSFETGSEEAESARKAVPETEDGSVNHAGAGESPASDSSNAGGSHVTPGQNAHQISAVEPVSSSTAFYLEDAGSGA